MHKFIYKYIFTLAFFTIPYGSFALDTDQPIVLKAPEQIQNTYFKNRKEFMDFYKKASRNHYNFHIEGKIVDPDGKLIPDVTVTLQKQDSMYGKTDQRVEIIKTGNFSFSSTGCYSWYLKFEKARYYEAGTGFILVSLSKILSSGEAILTGKTIARKAEIILYPWGDFSKELLSVNHNVFTYSEEGVEKKITGLVVPYEGEGKRIRKDEEFKFSFKNEKELPKNLIYIAPGRNKDGNLDGTIRLKTNAGDGGFFPVKYEGTHCFRRMWEAPADGYQPELIIKENFSNFLQHNDTKTPHREASAVTVLNKAKQENDASKEASYIVFYFKVMGYYGKGLIMPMWYDSKLEKDKASLRIYLYVNRKQNERNTNTWLGTNW